ncbi:MAG TPA: 2-oxoacid:ferredoxin oxidoreductase subunit beta, partial [Burkholderiales bacterium]|nr:2-oxoacid:ferredoxin oxidoreductase subunit beta [Burkholderiales bacterium]
NEAVNHLDVMLPRETITADYAPGEVEEVTQHDGSVLKLRKLAAEYDIHDRIAAMNFLQQHKAAGEIVTGVLHLDPEPEDLHAHLGTVETPFNRLAEKELCPGATALEQFNAAHR